MELGQIDCDEMGSACCTSGRQVACTKSEGKAASVWLEELPSVKIRSTNDLPAMGLAEGRTASCTRRAAYVTRAPQTYQHSER